MKLDCLLRKRICRWDRGMTRLLTWIIIPDLHKMNSSNRIQQRDTPPRVPQASIETSSSPFIVLPHRWQNPRRTRNWPSARLSSGFMYILLANLWGDDFRPLSINRVTVNKTCSHPHVQELVSLKTNKKMRLRARGHNDNSRETNEYVHHIPFIQFLC